MRILRVSHSGAVDAWRERERELRLRGHDVRLLTARTWEAGGREVPLVPRVGAGGEREDVVGVPTLGRHPALFVYAPGPLWRALGEPHVVLDVHEEPFALATAEVLALRALRRVRGRGPRAPYVLYSAQNLAKRYPVPFRWFERWALRGAAAVVTCNEGAARIVRAKGLRGPAVVVPLGVPARAAVAGGSLSDDASGPRSDGPRAPGASVRVGYAGRLEQHKGVQVLLDAVEADPRLHLRLAGGGSLRAAVAERAARSGGRVEVLGGLSPDELPGFYANVDVLAVPSLATPSWVEQFGRVAVEAMACGTPVVATSTGALPDVVGGAGLLVPPGDPEALREALVAVGTDPELAARLRAAGLERARECSWQEVAARYEEVYETVLGRVPAASAEREPRQVEVVVVAYGRPDLLGRAVAPLAGRLPVTVVDNSSDPEVRAVAERHGVRYLDPGRNGGFAAGVSHGLTHRLVPGADVLLLNPDATITPEAVRLLSDALAADPRLASVGPSQSDDDGRPARVGWPFPTPGRAWLAALGLGRVVRRTDYVIGSVLLLRAEALDDVGGLDDGYFLYAEETDWARRAADAGWHHAVVPAAHAVHAGGATSADPARRDRHFHASLERYLRAHHGAAGWWSARAAMLLGAAVRAALPGERGVVARRRVALLGRPAVRA